MLELQAVVDVNPKWVDRSTTDVAFVGMADLDADSGTASTDVMRARSEVARGYTPFSRGDILAAKITPCWENGKVGVASIVTDDGAGSTEFHVLRPRADLDTRYLLHFLRSPMIRAAGTLRMTGSGGQKRVPVEFLKTLRVPAPEIDEQRRIAAILDQADALRAKRRQVIDHLDSLTQSIFHDMFGDRQKSIALEELCTIVSGGTPSKSDPTLWQGRLPWFSAKDLKAADLWDSRDHVADDVAERTNLKLLPSGTTIIVVRGMILAHTLPVSVLRAIGTINQDLKGLVPHDADSSDFIAATIRSNASELLAKAGVAAHGTRKIDTTSLLKIVMPASTARDRREFSHRVAHVRQMRFKLGEASLAANDLFASLQSRAFRGEL